MLRNSFEEPWVKAVGDVATTAPNTCDSKRLVLSTGTVVNRTKANGPLWERIKAFSDAEQPHHVVPVVRVGCLGSHFPPPVFRV